MRILRVAISTRFVLFTAVCASPATLHTTLFSAQFLMTPAEAHAAAAAEGLALLRAENAMGFKGVSRSNSVSKPFIARLMVGGRNNNLGCFVTAEEAALAVARFLGPLAQPAPMTAAEAHAAAAEEGLTLLRGRSDSSTGFKGVNHLEGRTKPFKAEMKHGGRINYLGTFVTAEEAALAVARFLGPEGVETALAAAAPETAPMTAAEAHAAAAEEGRE